LHLQIPATYFKISNYALYSPSDLRINGPFAGRIASQLEINFKDCYKRESSERRWGRGVRARGVGEGGFCYWEG
jgi:hypothetical protein